MSFERRLKRAIADRDIDRIESIFGEIYMEYGKLVGFIISKYVTGMEDVEELTNDVFVNFSRVLCRIELDNIKYYLVVQAKNSAINFLKRKERTQSHITYVENVDFGCVDEDHELYKELIDDLCEYLSDEEVNIIVLHSVYEKSFVEIAERLERSDATVRAVYHRAIAKYKKKRGIR